MKNVAQGPASRSRLPAIGLMLLGLLLFAINDALGKWLVASYSVGQLLLVRSLAALLVLAPFVRRRDLADLVRHRPALQGLRVVLSTLEVAAFYWAVFYLPLADVMTFYLAGPIYVAGFAVLFLGERIDAPRAMLVLAGFAGVLVVLQPSAATLTGPALIAFAGSLFFALLMITTRTLRGTSDAGLVLGQTLGALLFGALAAPLAWTTPSLPDLALLSLLGVVALLAHVLVNRSLKLAPASVVAPFQYTLLLWGMLLGWLVFGDMVGTSVLVGAGIIVGAGLGLACVEREEQPIVGPGRIDSARP